MQARLYSALRELADHNKFWWRQASMEKLYNMGLAERVGYVGSAAAYRITFAGRVKLAEMEEGK